MFEWNCYFNTMCVGRFCLNVIFILFIRPVVFSEAKSAPSGAFKSSIVSVKDCETPYHPHMNDPPMVFLPVVHNISNTLILSGNVTVFRDIKNVKQRMKSYIWEDGAWKLNYLMNNVNCHGVLLHMISIATNVKYDRKSCMYFKGQYFFNNLDVNAVHHFWTTVMEYGKILWRIEVYSQKLGSFFCHDFEVTTEPV